MLIRETKYFYVLRAQFLSRRKVQRINCLTFLSQTLSQRTRLMEPSGAKCASRDNNSNVHITSQKRKNWRKRIKYIFQQCTLHLRKFPTIVRVWQNFSIEIRNVWSENISLFLSRKREMYPVSLNKGNASSVRVTRVHMSDVSINF